MAAYSKKIPKYDLEAMKGGVHGKYAKKYKQWTNIIRLEQDVAEVLIVMNLLIVRYDHSFRL